MPNKIDALVSSSIVRAARIWYENECIAHRELPPLDQMTLSDLLAIAVPRVEAVYAGEVKWSEASNGDRAVWVGRPRSAHGHNLDANKHEYWENLWDTIRIGKGATVDRFGYEQWKITDKTDGTCWMFGNHNIGAWYLCNLQIAGQLVGDHHLDLHQMYAHVDRALEPGETIGATLMIGSKIVSQAKISDLIIGHPVAQHVPPRQNFSVQIVWFAVRRPIQIEVHLEGPSLRSVM